MMGRKGVGQSSHIISCHTRAITIETNAAAAADYLTIDDVVAYCFASWHYTHWEGFIERVKKKKKKTTRKRRNTRCSPSLPLRSRNFSEKEKKSEHVG